MMRQETKDAREMTRQEYEAAKALLLRDAAHAETNTDARQTADAQRKYPKKDDANDNQ